MRDPIGEHNIHAYLTAFADGELDAADNLAILDFLARNPDTVRLMRDQQRLRLVALRAVRGSTPTAPAALRGQIEAMAAATLAAGPIPEATVPRPAAGGRTPEADGPNRRRPWPVSAAVVASLVLGLAAGGLAGRFLLSPRDATPDAVARALLPAASPDKGTMGAGAADVVPVGLVTAATRLHVDCSRLADRLHAAGYPPQFGELAAALRQDLVGGNVPFPDLSGVGYRFVGAGPCGDPLEGTIHLLYKSPPPESVISLFVQRNAGQFPMRAGTLYTLSAAGAPFPVHAWRTERVVYFLVADDQESADRARAAITTAPKP